jgi:hypothetical protein
VAGPASEVISLRQRTGTGANSAAVDVLWPTILSRRQARSRVRIKVANKPKNQTEEQRDQNNQGDLPTQHVLFPKSFFTFVHLPP